MVHTIGEKIKDAINKLLNTGFFHVFGSNVINKVLGFISSVFIVRLISKADYGVYTTALNHLSFFLLLSGMGMVSAVLQLCSENAKNRNKNLEIYEYGSSIGIKFNLLLGVAILIFTFFSNSNIEGANKILSWLAFIPFFEGINEFQKIYFRSNLDNRSYAFSNSMGAFLVVVCSVSGAFISGVKGLIAGRYVAAILIAIITKICLKGPVKFKTSPTKNIEKKVLYKISMISMANNGISELLYLFDILIIGEVMGSSTAVADYKIAIIIPTALIFIPASVCIYIYPYFSMNKDNGEWVKRNFDLLIIVMGIINVVISITLIIFAPFIIELVFGKQYLSAVSMFRISALNYFFSGTFRIITGNLLVTQRKLKFNFYASIIAGLVNLVSNYVFINIMGPIGAAWTTLGISFFSGIIYTFYFYKVIKKIK
ncbi:MAG: oligosaccharide flippase family protein [Firmicutes bacterium]|nr:oligosaccharide flippase family protein [Bacillota bacterium]